MTHSFPARVLPLAVAPVSFLACGTEAVDEGSSESTLTTVRDSSGFPNDPDKVRYRCPATPQLGVPFYEVNNPNFRNYKMFVGKIVSSETGWTALEWTNGTAS